MSPEEQLKYEPIQYHWRLVRLLASCCEGENRFIESMCQNIFSIPEILEVLNNNNIAMNYKRPYMRFLLWAYINTAGSMYENGTAELHLEEGLWRFIESMITEMNTILKMVYKFFFSYRRYCGLIFETHKVKRVIFIDGVSFFLWNKI
jgi:hypothetical protein